MNNDACLQFFEPCPFYRHFNHYTIPLKDYSFMKTTHKNRSLWHYASLIFRMMDFRATREFDRQEALIPCVFQCFYGVTTYLILISSKSVKFFDCHLPDRLFVSSPPKCHSTRLLGFTMLF